MSIEGFSGFALGNFRGFLNEGFLSWALEVETCFLRGFKPLSKGKRKREEGSATWQVT